MAACGFKRPIAVQNGHLIGPRSELKAAHRVCEKCQRGRRQRWELSKLCLRSAADNGVLTDSDRFMPDQPADSPNYHVKDDSR